jgi:hypothetical protein
MVDLLRLVDTALAPGAMLAHEGQAYQKPRLDVIRHYTRRVRTSWLPLVGRALSLVAVVEHPDDLTLDASGCRTLLERVGTVMSARHSPFEGLSLAISTLVVTQNPIEPDDDPMLAKGLVPQPRLRMVPLALFKINLSDTTMAQSYRAGPGDLFPEPALLSDVLCRSLRRYVPFLDV